MMTIKNYLLPGFLVILSYSFQACTSENEEDIEPDDQEERCVESVSLSNDIIPIINQNCAISGCHVSGTNRVNLTLKENILQHAEQIKNFTQSDYMPPEGSGKQLSESQKESIFCWVDQGALDN
ncbi:2-polyprenyl-6-methoxyphenol hydroxylase [Cyclobacterium salsum]|uniref:2-polyprenyl-6-methoxyphenol hydroxylase n=1 Tax=Cyclobacterium salsum TaxID=2666329 RepID=UPI001F1D8E40|nr:2-polyprenyl-6-methoxyphenol hydroxylase [Cyclobacterium salsum]